MLTSSQVMQTDRQPGKQMDREIDWMKLIDTFLQLLAGKAPKR
jgi:hypothetical protein